MDSHWVSIVQGMDPETRRLFKCLSFYQRYSRSPDHTRLNELARLLLSPVQYATSAGYCGA